MAERDTTPVTVTLDRARPYRANESDRSAVWVGPGQVQVPAWVAEEWRKPRQPVPVATPYRASSNLQQAIAQASDDELIAIPGVGEKSLEALRAWATEQPAEDAQQPQDTPQGDEAIEPPVVIETVTENPGETVEVVEVVDATEVDATERKPRGRNRNA